jgi:hypothetical protein
MRATNFHDLSILAENLRTACIQYLQTLNLDGGPAIVMVKTFDEFAIVYDQSMKYVRSDRPEDAVGGNRSLFVDTKNNAIYLMRPGVNSEECIPAARAGHLESLLTRVL